MLAAEYIPAELAHAPKIPQTIPIDEWFRGPMEQYVRDHLDRRRLAEEGTFDPEVIQRCLEDHIEGRANHKWVLWTCLTYIVWRAAVLEA